MKRLSFRSSQDGKDAYTFFFDPSANGYRKYTDVIANYETGIDKSELDDCMHRASFSRGRRCRRHHRQRVDRALRHGRQKRPYPYLLRLTVPCAGARVFEAPRACNRKTTTHDP